MTTSTGPSCWRDLRRLTRRRILAWLLTLYRACEKHDIKYIIEGHSFRTEGVSPPGWAYVDGGISKASTRGTGKLPLKTFPNLSLFNFLRWTTISNIKKVRPLYFIDYHKEEAEKNSRR